MVGMKVAKSKIVGELGQLWVPSRRNRRIDFSLTTSASSPFLLLTMEPGINFSHRQTRDSEDA
jgi:hypothetical protein